MGWEKSEVEEGEKMRGEIEYREEERMKEEESE